MSDAYKAFYGTGIALEPIHVGTGGSRLGRVDNAIVRDPATGVPKIPGSSLAGVSRAYVAMAEGKYPKCAGQGGGKDGHCGESECPVCTVFGFAKGDSGGFAGLASFSDMHILLFPVPSPSGPAWITCPRALRIAGLSEENNIENIAEKLNNHTVFCSKDLAPETAGERIVLGWLSLPCEELDDDKALLNFVKLTSRIDGYNRLIDRIAVVSDVLFGRLIDSNLEVRTSVAIDPSTGAAKDTALFSYEALPMGTVLSWQLTCRNPEHFKIGEKEIHLNSPDGVKNIVDKASNYMEFLGVGGMSSRGMGRFKVLSCIDPDGTNGSTSQGGTADGK